jgi:hypothetical protein
MKELLKKRLEMFIQMQWLKTINKEVDKRNKLYEKYQRSVYVISALIKEYESKYGELKTKSEDTE